MENGFLFLVNVVALSGSVFALNDNPKLILISFDGFRHDLLNQTMTPNIYQWATQNSWFHNGLSSLFITYTAPNHMGIVTGLYEERHGIVSNYFYDMATNKSFDVFNSTGLPGVVNASLQREWYNGEPIWITNERGGKGRLSSTYFWPMGEAPFPTSPSRGSYHKSWTTYGNLSTWMADCDAIIEQFTRETDPINFLAWYIAEPDHTLHTNGFFNGALKAKVKELDQLFRYFLGKLEDRGLDKQLNVILTADHGHAEIIDRKHIMCIKDYLPPGDYFVGDHMLYLRDEKLTREIYDRLTEAVKTHDFDVNVYLKSDFPVHYHYHNSTRIGAVILEPAIGSSISFSCTAAELERDYGTGAGQVKFNSSTHGMDPDLPEMRALLVMGGPSIAQNKKIPLIPQNIDLYPFMCLLLNVTPADYDGKLSPIKMALRTVEDVKSRQMHQNIVTDSLGFLVFFVPPFIVVVLYLLYGCRHTILKDDPGWALKSNGYMPLHFGEEVPQESRGEEISMSALLHGDDSSVESI